MKKLNFFILVFTFIGAVMVFAQANSDRIPKGMEAIKLGGSGEWIIPKGAKVRKVGAQLIVEGTKEYVSRRFEEMEERFAAVEKNQEMLQEEVETLKGMLNAAQNVSDK